MDIHPNSVSQLTLFHGSPVRVPAPKFGFGNPCNDYGLAFYCTEEYDLACEWACPTAQDGYVNEYRLDLSDLAVLDLGAEPYGALNWLAVLVQNRRFDTTSPLMREAKNYLLSTFAPPLDSIDVITGYRADDSYFSFARAFLDGRISLQQLERALVLGKMGTQWAVKSPAAFKRLQFVGSAPVQGAAWNVQRMERDSIARSEYRSLSHEPFGAHDTFILDLIRGRS